MKVLLIAALCILASPSSNAQGLSDILTPTLQGLGLSGILERVLKPVGELVSCLGKLVESIIEGLGGVLATSLTADQAATQYEEAVKKFKDCTAGAGFLKGAGSFIAGLLNGLKGPLKAVFTIIENVLGSGGSGGGATPAMSTTAAAR